MELGDVNPSQIIKYTLYSSLASATVTTAYESAKQWSSSRQTTDQEGLKSQNRGRLRLRPQRSTATMAGLAALNSGFVAFTFFSMREYFITPALRSVLQRKASSAYDSTASHSKISTWSDMRMQNVADSTLTGALLGAGYNAFRRGPRGIPSGAITAGLACTILQFVVNEAGVMRVRFVSRVTSPAKAQEPSEESQSPSLGSRLLSLIGFRKLSDEEYLRSLRTRRQKYLERIRELEEQVNAQNTDDSDQIQQEDDISS